MLGKQFKYDMRSLSRILLIVHAFVVVMAIIGSFFSNNSALFQSKESNMWIILFFLFYVIFISVAAFSTQLIIAVDFYKSMFSNQGYLTRTLPLKHSTTFLSKVLSGSLWCFIDLILIFLSIMFVFFSPAMLSEMSVTYQELTDSFQKELGYSLTTFIIFIGIYSTIGVISGVLMIYLSIAVGQLFTSHKILGSVAVYFGITTLTSLLSSGLMIPTGMFSVTSNVPSIDYRFLINSTGIFLVMYSVVTGVVSYILSLYLIKKKTDL
ncbi:heme/copper-type cytochrome/quinol oxidase subunit 2 [Lachnospiraceae bacterium PF1-21]|uniref:ABC transporter permease n=1 Tax=Ohessyouella blattaphilus TaxID=2949333 RepID=A0ABT1EGV3_9FIRM|nr:hypothetical protein [Ohessyouella blattaphilus]MCP1109923.1 hypothetical protein [Ohessyouella blattaphilus]MCR8563317.1 hypothetical protein [Ohessyouella blattaphilus]MDL2249527.1 hypothetical protein [Lachnospiraceae bacterium OttesenSCG-928-J05]